MNSTEIAAFLELPQVGTPREITRIRAFDASNNDSNTLMWVSEKNLPDLSALKDGIFIVPENAAIPAHSNCVFILAPSPRRSFQKIISQYFKKPTIPGIAGSTKIHPSCVVGSGCTIGENVVIEENVRIGDGVVILHNTVVKSDTVIHDRCTIGCNCTIGGVGFGYEPNESGEYELIEHIGNVVLEENVEIGNNTCVDRAVLGSTVLRKNVKVDNLVHIAHGCDIGENSLVIANAMVAGSVQLGKNCWVAPSASILNKIRVGTGATIGISAVVLKDVAKGEVVVGNPGKVIKVKEVAE